MFLLPRGATANSSSPGNPRPVSRSRQGSHGGLFCAGSQCTETLFALEEWSPSPSPVEFCTQAALTFKAKYPEGSSFQCLTLRLSWGPVFKWKYPCVACAGLILFVFTFWWRAGFSMNDCYFFVQCPRVVIPLMEGVPAVTRACTRC